MTSQPKPVASLNGLYVILDPSVCAGRDPVEVLLAAAGAGARLFQYRDKASSMKDAYHRALQLREAANEAGATFIVNDRCDLALAVEADGVHLGQQDLPVTDARKLMGAGKIIGVSTHNMAQVDEAARAGADYIGFGPIFATSTKKDHEPVVGLEGIRQARARTALPMFAIGGISPAMAGAVMSHGADGIAVISAICAAEDVGEAVIAFLARMGRSKE